MSDIRFVTYNQALRLHAASIRQYGGSELK